MVDVGGDCCVASVSDECVHPTTKGPTSPSSPNTQHLTSSDLADVPVLAVDRLRPSLTLGAVMHRTMSEEPFNSRTMPKYAGARSHAQLGVT